MKTARQTSLILLTTLCTGLGGWTAHSERVAVPRHIPQPDFWIRSANGGVPGHFVDSAVFPVSKDSMRVEAYYRITYDQLDLRATATGYAAKVRFDLSGTKDGKSKASARVHKERTIEIPEEVLAEAASHYLLEQLAIVLERAPHRMESRVELEGSTGGARAAAAHWWSDLPASPDGELVFGEVQLTNQIAPLSEEAAYPKGGVDFYPNPTRRFTSNLSTLVFFAENFNAGSSPGAIHLRYGIEDLYGVDRWSGERGRVDGGVVKLEPGLNATLSGFNVGALETGFYRLVMEYVDSSGEIAARRDRIFSFLGQTGQLSPPDPYVSTLDADLLASYDSRFLRYLAAPVDRERYKALTDDPARRRFIEDWWARVAENRSLPVKPFRASILRRYELAEERYSEPHREGWRTDRGRILVIYGEPNERIVESFGAEARAGELWEMVIRGERKFCYFLDRQGTGRYELEATDIEGEAAARRVRPTLTVGVESRF